MKKYAHFAVGNGRIALEAEIIRLGDDIQCLLRGGAAHIGAVALAWPVGEGGRQSRLCCLPGHREGEIARRMAESLATVSGRTVCVSAGIHFDRITPEEIVVVESLARELTDICLKALQYLTLETVNCSN
jgi:hypothetical protein